MLDLEDSDSDEDWFDEDRHVVQQSPRRLEVVTVISSFTGEERRGEVNTLTGHLDTGVQLQLDNVDKKMSENCQDVCEACGDCGKVRV